MEGVGAGGGETEGEPDQGVLAGDLGPPEVTEQGGVLRLLTAPAVPGLLAASLHGHQETLQLAELQSLQEVGQSSPPPPVLLVSVASLASLGSQSADQLGPPRPEPEHLRCGGILGDHLPVCPSVSQCLTMLYHQLLHSRLSPPCLAWPH